METIYTFLLNLQLDMIQVCIAAGIFFAIGFWVGNLRRKKLLRKMQKMEREIMDLNSELLYNTRERLPLLRASHG